MTEEVKDRNDEDKREDSEEIPAWFAAYADKMDKRLESLEKKDSEANESADRKDLSEEDVKENTEGEKKDEDEKEEAHKAAEELEDRKKEEEREDESEEKKEEDWKEGAEKAREEKEAKDREDRARKDAQVSKQMRDQRGKIEELEAKLKGLYREPSFEDRNALAAARSRADAVYQAVSGRPASEPLPGESPIAYRKRMADGLRKYSARFKDERVDSLTGSSFALVEDQIYADAQEMAKSPEVLKVGELRHITRQDSGHTVTEYIGDPTAAWAPFSAGAAMRVKLTRPSVH